MQEVNADGAKDPILLLIEQIQILNETNMAMLVQLSRLYDLAASTYYKNDTDGEAEALLNSHEKGDIMTTAPVLRSFGEPEEEDD